MSDTAKANTPNLEQFLTRFRRFVMSRFGVEILFRPLDAESDQNRRLVADLMKNTTNTPLKSKEGPSFPVYQSRQLKGLVTIPLIDARQRPEIVDLIEFFLDGPMALRDRLDSLTHMENALQRTQAHPDRENVIPIRARRQTELTFSQSCLIESRDLQEAQKLAKEVHEVSGRYALVPIEDLSWTNADELLELGPITLLIADIQRLSIQQQEQILSFLELRHGATDPQIIGCTSRSYSELRASAEINMNFLYRLSSCFLRMDRALKLYKSTELLQHLLMTPVVRPTEPL